ncbi:MFS transporter [Agromyces bauzanensis]
MPSPSCRVDATLLNVALPSIRSEYAAELSQTQWVLDAYTLTLASFLLLAGALGDRFGRRRALQLGLVVFATGATAATFAPSIGFLVAARIVQGLGGSMLTPVSIAIITATYTSTAERARAIGIWGGMTGIAMGVGPVLGGLLVEFAGWPAVFWVSVSLALTTAVAAGVFVPDTSAATRRPFDLLGQALIALALCCIVGALIELPNHGPWSPLVAGLAAVGAVAVGAFIWVELGHPHPAVDLRFLRSIPFAAAGLSAIVAFSAYSAFLFTMTFYLQQDRGLPPHLAGLVLLPVAISLALASAVSGRLVSVAGPRPALLIAVSAFAAVGASLAVIDLRTPLPVVMVATIPLGVAFAMVNTPITESAVAGMPRSRAGSAAGIMSSGRQVGIALGIALAGVLASGTMSATTATGLVIVACAIILLLLALAGTGRRGDASAAGIAELLDDRWHGAGRVGGLPAVIPGARTCAMCGLRFGWRVSAGWYSGFAPVGRAL